MSGKRMLVSHIWPRFGSNWPWLVLQPTQNLGHLPLPHMQRHFQRKAISGETWKLCLFTWVLLALEMVTIKSQLPAYTETLSYLKYILVNTFLCLKLINFGFLLIASNFYSQRIPAQLCFIPQPFSSYVKREWFAIPTLQIRNCTIETKPRFYTWIRHLIFLMDSSGY